MNKTSVTRIINPLKNLMKSLGLGISDWCISGECSWVINGYDIPIRENHIDIYVKESKIHWKVRNRMQTIPPKGSVELDKLSNFISKYNVAIHMVPLPKPGITENLVDKYSKKTLLGKTVVNVIEPIGNLYDLEATLKSYTEDDLGAERVTRWKKYLDIIYKSSEINGEKQIQEKSRYILDKYFR